MRYIVSIFCSAIFSLMFSLILVSPSAFAISKCQDADGKWHYGDHAPDLCARSKITQMNQHGTVVGGEDAPKTAEQIEQERIAEEKQQAILEKEQAVEEEKRRLLNIYETVEDIDRVRDNQLYAVQSNIDVHNAYLGAMNNKIIRLEEKERRTTRTDLKEKVQQEIAEAKENVEKFNGQLQKLETQKIDIIEKFSAEKEQYIALTNKLRLN